MTARLSVVLTIHNERDNIAPLLDEIRSALKDQPHEVLLVDDGSTDGSAGLIEDLAQKNADVSGIFLARNYGQTAALSAGFQQAQGDIIVAMDADGQNDPQDIPRMLARLSEGYDVVSGWRRRRRDPFWSRRLPSAVANRMIACVTGVPLHDFGCTLKAYRKPVLEDVKLYGEMHRLLPAWCAWRGARIAELEVNHRPRQRGRSKYGIGRTFKVLLDLLTTKFISGYLSKPSYLFGGIASIFYLLAVLSTAVVFYDKLGPDQWAPLRIPLLLLACFLGIVGTLLLMLGLLAELIVRVYYEAAGERPYRVLKVLRR